MDGSGEPNGLSARKSSSAVTLTSRNESEVETSDRADDHNTRWDYGSCCAPKCCQVFNRIEWVVVFWCIAAFAQSGYVNGAVNAVLSTIQLRYQITNVQLGVLVAVYDAITVIIIAFSAYYGSQGRQPRWVGLGMLILGLSAFLFALPQIAFGTYQYSFSGEPTCSANSTSSCSSMSSGQSSFWVFLASQILAGIGASPLYTVGITYLDENAGPKLSALYIGIFMTLTVIGPAVGFVITGILLNIIYVDAPTTATINSTNPVWVGAWWIPFLGFGGLILLFTWGPITGYPERLPKSKAKYIEQSSQQDLAVKKGNLLKALKPVLKSSTVWLIALNSAAQSFKSSIVTSFGPKYLQLAFNIPSGTASILLGAVIVAGAAVGVFVGGLVLKFRKLSVKQMLNLLLATTGISWPIALCFLLSCSRPYYAGVTHTYPNVTVDNYTVLWSAPSTISTVALTSGCNDACYCSATSYDPVCGADGVLYYSPCYAGCQKYRTVGNYKVYYNCSCVQPATSSLSTISRSPFYTLSGNLSSFASTVTTGCSASSSSIGCNMPLFLALMFLVAVLGFIPNVAVIKVLIASVPSESSSLSLALNSVVFRVLGVIPGPIIGGVIFDEMCTFWQRTACFSETACMSYDVKTLSYWLTGVFLFVHLVQLISCLLARVLYKAPKESEALQQSKPPEIDLDSAANNTSPENLEATDF